MSYEKMKIENHRVQLSGTRSAIITVNDFFAAMAVANISRLRLVEYQGEGVVIVQVPPSQIERAREILRDRTAVSILVLLDELPWSSCWFNRYRLVSVPMGRGRP